MITVEHLSGGYGKKPVIQDLQVDIQKGEFFALLGPNGSGKTTLFKLITGQLPITQGSILIDGKPMSSMTKLEKAKKVAVLSQESHVTFDFTVEEIIALGRYPYQTGLFKRISANDRKIIELVMKVAHVEQFRDAQFRTLSGGEKQRVLLAKALAQEPEVLLLDEPTNHLDIKHTFQILNMLKEWQHSKELTIFAILHDLNVASLYADRVALLHEGSFLEVGDVNILRNEEQLKKVYEVDIKTHAHPIVAKPQLLMSPLAAASHTSMWMQDSLSISQKENDTIISFQQPMRTISNADIGGGIEWLQHFCFVNEEADNIDSWMHKHDVPAELALGIGYRDPDSRTALFHHRGDIDMTLSLLADGTAKYSGIHMCLFINETLDDTSLLSCFQTAAEAKALTALQFSMEDKTADDRLAISASQSKTASISAEETAFLTIGIRNFVSSSIRAYVNEFMSDKRFTKQKG